MRLKELRICNFKCFGSEPETISFDDSITTVIGPNGSGKTAILQALARMFAINPSLRKIRREDFHVPYNESELPEERTLVIEADFCLPEAGNTTSASSSNAIPPCFNHMRYQDSQGLMIRYRLEATMGIDGDIDDGLYYVIGQEPNGDIKKKRVPRAERNIIAVHYLPAKRDPNDHIQASTSSLLGRIIRAVDWSDESESYPEIASRIQDLISGNPAISRTNTKLSSEWRKLHKGSHFTDAKLVFGIERFEKLRNNVSVEFNPAHVSNTVDYSLLSDGQKSLLYLSLVTAFIEVCRIALAEQNQDLKVDLNKLNPPVFSLIAVEEPENSLSPHYLGRINALLKAITAHEDAQAVVTTHSPSMLRRVPPERIRHTRIGENRLAVVKEISMPPSTEMDAYKFIREGILSNPEIYFSRFVVLGEGASEDIVLPKLFEAMGVPVDENGITIAQLGGRHVNYMWKLLDDLEIPYATLLDLDLCRYQGGWGRIKYAADQLVQIGKHPGGDQNKFPKWNENNLLDGSEVNNSWLTFMEGEQLFYSQPLDLDFSMIKQFPQAYDVDSEELSAPDDSTCKSVLGKSHVHNEWYSDDEKLLFEDYHKLFKVGSKPAAHISALSKLSLGEIAQNIPEAYKNLISTVKVRLEGIYE